MTGTQYADILRDAAMLSGGAPQYAFAHMWKTARGVPLGTAAEEAAAAARDGLLSLWLRECARTLRGRYAICAPEFSCAMVDAAGALRASGMILLPAAVCGAREARTFEAWSAAAYANGLLACGKARAQERVFLPWLAAMRARYTQE